jgi:Beta-galactosidase
MNACTPRLLTALAAGICLSALAARPPAPDSWNIGTPIVTYWAGPTMSDATARQMAEGGWNLVWCGEKDLDLVRRHGLRGQLQDPLLAPATLDDAAQREKLDALIARVKDHPALYAYFITDEPSASAFPGLGRLVAYLRERDPRHFAYINLFPTYANNEQLGNPGDTLNAYQAHLNQYLDRVRPSLVSYDHYQFTTQGDSGQYFLNLALVRQAAQDAGLPFLNIVQACSWAPSMRVPKPDEMRYLVYTTLAYGAQGISYYVYCWPGHTGGIAAADGTPTPLYGALSNLNREFVAIARQLQPLRSVGVYHAGMLPQGTSPLPAGCAFSLAPPPPPAAYHPPEPVQGVLLGCFARAGNSSDPRKATHALVVNLNYAAETVVPVHGRSRLEVFNPRTGQWARSKGKNAELRLPPGGGALVRMHR